MGVLFNECLPACVVVNYKVVAQSMRDHDEEAINCWWVSSARSAVTIELLSSRLDKGQHHPVSQPWPSCYHLGEGNARVHADDP